MIVIGWLAVIIWFGDGEVSEYFAWAGGGLVFCLYFIPCAVIARLHLSQIVVWSLAGLLFPVWIILTIIIPFAGTLLIAPVGWILLMTVLFAGRVRRAGVITVGWLAVLTVGAAVLALEYAPRLSLLCAVWHLFCATTCIVGINWHRERTRELWSNIRIRNDKPLCLNCKYEIAGLSDDCNTCPECGSRFRELSPDELLA